MAFSIRVSGKLEELVRKAIEETRNRMPEEAQKYISVLSFAQTALFMTACRAGGEAISPLLNEYNMDIDDASTWGVELVGDDTLS